MRGRALTPTIARVGLASVLLIFLTAFPLAGAAIAKNKTPCKPTLAACPDDGCGTDFDPNLNRQKNIRSDDQTPTLRTLTWMKALDDPDNFTEGDSREELTALGEGQAVTVVAYLLVAKPELGGESCNCGLQTKEETDNHLVLVSKATVTKFPEPKSGKPSKSVFSKREKESVTAEFTPRVRLSHPNFTRESIQPIIEATPQQALLVRVSGLLLFDSEHFIRNPLVRKTNWEIHPVFNLEFCRDGTCKSDSDQGWESLDNLTAAAPH
jgi:hypothetical protein